MPQRDHSNEPRSGYAKKVLLLDPNNPTELGLLTGRGSGFTWADVVEGGTVDELNQTRPTEWVFGRFGAGTGTINVVDVPQINDALPTPGTSSRIGPYIVMELIGDNRPHAGTPVNVFKDVYFTGINGGPTAGPGVQMLNATVTYLERLNGKQYCEEQGIPYPPPAE